jgi:hypothetical protein
MDTLDQIGVWAGTDKSSVNHKYLATYERYLHGVRFDPIHFLEIGIKDGDSLRMWDKYFDHPKSLLSAIDINSDCVKNVPDNHRWQGFHGKQSSPSVLDAVIARGPLDVVLDDGSHRGADQKASLERLWPAVAPGGLYIIEDLHCAYQKSPHWNKGTNIVDYVRMEFIDKFLRVPEEEVSVASFVHFHKRIIVIGK